jgi:hypothetical protein
VGSSDVSTIKTLQKARTYFEREMENTGKTKKINITMKRDI